MDIVLERILSLIPRKPDGKFVHGAVKDFALGLGLKSGNIVSDWIAGRSCSYLTYVYQVSSKYGVPIEWLLGKTDQKEKDPTENGEVYEEIGPYKRQLLEAVADMTPEEMAVLLDRIEKIKASRI